MYICERCTKICDEDYCIDCYNELDEILDESMVKLKEAFPELCC